MSNISNIVFKASNGKNSVSGTTAAEAVRLFLKTFKNRSFSVHEYRNGAFTCTIGVPDAVGDCFYRNFKTRDEARQFVLMEPAAT